MIAELKFGDLVKLKEIAGTEFSFPDLSSGLYCSQKALFDSKGKFIGAALLKLTSEAMLILDKETTELTRAIAISEAFKQVPKELDKFGLDQAHVFVLPEDDWKYASFLMNHFGFKRATGIPLVYTR